MAQSQCAGCALGRPGLFGFQEQASLFCGLEMTIVSGPGKTQLETIEQTFNQSFHAGIGKDIELIWTCPALMDS